MSTPVTSSYNAVFTLQKREYTGSGKTFVEAIRSMKLPRTVSAGVLVVTKGKDKKERIISPVLVRRLSAPSPTVKDLAIKNLDTLFGL